MLIAITRHNKRCAIRSELNLDLVNIVTPIKMVPILRCNKNDLNVFSWNLRLTEIHAVGRRMHLSALIQLAIGEWQFTCSRQSSHVCNRIDLNHANRPDVFAVVRFRSPTRMWQTPAPGNQWIKFVLTPRWNVLCFAVCVPVHDN